MKKIVLLIVLCTISFSFLGFGSFSKKSKMWFPFITTGVVSEANTGVRISGVTVKIKGLPYGTLTDANGAYSITSDGPGSTLVFSKLGFYTVEKPVHSIVDVNLVTNGEY